MKRVPIIKRLAIMAFVISCNLLLSGAILINSAQVKDSQKPTLEKVKSIQLDTAKEGLLSFSMRIFMLNSGRYIVQDRLIKMYASDGRFIKNIGALGQGKGEYQSMSNIYTNGSIIGVHNRSKNMIIFYDENGNYIKSIFLKGVFYYSAAFYENNKTILLGYKMIKENIVKYFMDCYDFDGTWLFRMGEYDPASPSTLGIGPLMNNFVSVRDNKLYLVMYDDIIVKCFDIKTRKLLWKADHIPREVKAPFITQSIKLGGRGKLSEFDRERDCPLCLNITKSGLVLVNTRFSTLVYNQSGKFVKSLKFSDPISSFICEKDNYLIGTLTPNDTKISHKTSNYKVVHYAIKE